MRNILVLLLFLISCKEKKQTIVEPIQINLPERPVINKKVVNEDNYELNIDKNFVLGKFNYRKDTSFVKVQMMHSSKTIYLKEKFIKLLYKCLIKLKLKTSI